MPTDPEESSSRSGFIPSLLRGETRIYILIAILVPLIAVVWFNPLAWATALLWAGGCWALGMTVGFFFAVPSQTSSPQTQISLPKSDESNPTASGSNPILPTANLEAVADWLTKIIVGLLLVNLKEIAPHLRAIARYLASGLGGNEKEPFAFALIVYFFTIGFLVGFIRARSLLRTQSASSVLNVYAGLADQMQRDIAKQIDIALIWSYALQI